MLVDDDILPSRNFDELAYFRTPVAATFGPGHELIFGNLLVEKSSVGLLWFSHMRHSSSRLPIELAMQDLPL